MTQSPRGHVVISTLAMPSDTNPSGDIFGGWLLSQMDIAGAAYAKKRTKSRVVTIAVEAMSFLKPVLVGDIVSCYVDVVNIGRTSIKTHIEVWVSRQYGSEFIKVTTGNFTYVAVDHNRIPHLVDRD